ncbi:MAG: heme ABC exporter ATP-binding protein CcmA [Alphaproteobacteria bacterium]
MSSFAGEKLECVRGERAVFSALDFTVEDGGALQLIGPNGSGKSSLLRLMASLIKPTAGRISWNGGNVADEPEAHRARLHYIGHLDGIQPLLTVAENLRFWAGLRPEGLNSNPGDATTEALDGFGLKALANIPCRFLSAGQCRRLALARLLAAPAALWLLDEPTTALDDDGVCAFHDAVRRHRAKGGVVVLASHGTETIEDARTLDLRAHGGIAVNRLV